MSRAELKARIKTQYGTCAAFADAMGVTRQTISNVVTGKTFPRNPLFWCEKLGIEPADAFVFFTPQPQKTKEA